MRIVHELGHAIDFQKDNKPSAGNPEGEYLMPNGSTVTFIKQGFFFKEYSVDDKQEAWADAFAAWVYNYNYGSQPFGYIDKGYIYISAADFGTQSYWTPMYDYVEQALTVNFN
jgi:hypothetical protein